ncbi:MAG: hypothetical protein JWQ63_2996 [Mucilaginibacter sp.]|nr:hypothetical protein [Mucilaginibacter sp.]
MTKETLKKLINWNLIGVSEAIWLSKFFVLVEIPIETESADIDTAKQILDFLESKNLILRDLQLDDELYLFSIKNHLLDFLERMKDDDEDEDNIDPDDDDDEYDGIYSKEELEKLRETEKNILDQGHSILLEKLINIIETKYQLVFNGFNKLEFQRAKSAFWKLIGLGDYRSYGLSPDAKKLLDDVYSSAEPVIKKKVEERELEIIPNIVVKFRNWITEFKHKPNKTNLKQFLKNNNIKLSNPNIDKVLNQT